MLTGTANLIIDLGNSSTKCKVQYGKDPNTGKFYQRRFDISNVFAPISSDYEVSDEYNPESSTIISVDARLNGAQIRGNFCNGELQEKEKPLTTIKPSATSRKYELDSTILSLNMAFLKASEAILAMNHTTDFSQLDVTWNVITLLPPGDLDEGKDKMVEIIKSITEVISVYPKAGIPIKINNVIVLPEGFCAYIGLVFQEGLKVRPEYKYLTEETILVFDIGAGTTDCLLIKNNKIVQNSKYTVNQGGNNVYQYVRRKLKLKGIDIEDTAIRAGVVSGVIKDGSKELNITDLINEAKEEIATKIVSEFQDFIELTDIKLRSIGCLLTCGGGSMSEKDTLALSDKLVAKAKSLAPNISAIKLPDDISPRDLNLIGASITAERY
jgi:hypothetical protein